MSTRWYPIYHRANPQLRVFLPNFWMKLIRSTNPHPENVVQFAVSMEMTDHDVHNYLTEIYKVPVIEVSTDVPMGKTSLNPHFRYVTKEEDVKIATVTLPKDVKFEFPDIFNKEESKKEALKERESLDEMNNQFGKYIDGAKNRPNLPPWFSI